MKRCASCKYWTTLIYPTIDHKELMIQRCGHVELTEYMFPPDDCPYYENRYNKKDGGEMK